MVKAVKVVKILIHNKKITVAAPIERRRFIKFQSLQGGVIFEFCLFFSVKTDIFRLKMGIFQHKAQKEITNLINLTFQQSYFLSYCNPKFVVMCELSLQLIVEKR